MHSSRKKFHNFVNNFPPFPANRATRLALVPSKALELLSVHAIAVDFAGSVTWVVSR
jgi:hypothetical protein